MSDKRVYFELSANADCGRCKGLGIVETVVRHDFNCEPPRPIKEIKFCLCVESRGLHV